MFDIPKEALPLLPILAAVLWLVILYVWSRVLRRKARLSATAKAAEPPPPPAPCGNDEVHYRWVDQGWKCPKCYRKAQEAAKEAERKALAKVLAREIVDLMDAKSKGGQ